MLPVLLMISGASGLGCQLVWTRQLTGGLGQELPAVLAVVAAFFAGLAVGAALLDRRLAATLHPARWYGGLETGIALWTVATAWLIPWLNEQLGPAIGLTPSPWRHWGVAFLGPLLALLPATAAMGATLPAMVRWAGRLDPTRVRVGSLYAANTAGAVAGTLAGALWLIPWLGFRQTLWSLAAASLGCGLTAFALARRADTSTATPTPGRLAAPAAGGAGPGVILLAGTGLLGIGYEILTVRLLTEVFDNTVFTFAVVLSVYLAGTAVGAWGERRWWPRAGTHDRLRSLLAGLAGSVAVGAAMLNLAPELRAAGRRLFGDGATGAMLAEAVAAATVLLPPTLLMGAMFAALAEWQRRGDGRVGRVVAWNTLGGTLAPLIFGVWLFPSVGGRGAFALLIAGYLALLLAGFRGAPTSGWRAARRPLAVGGAAALFATVFSADSRRLLRLLPGEQLQDLRAGPAETAVVVATPDGHRTLRVNHRFTMGGTASANAERRHSHLPLLLGAPRRALFLGVGTGISFGAMADHDYLRADGVEISPAVAAVSRAFDAESNRRDWSHRLTLHLADARRFVRASSTEYDVIVADLFHPARDGAGNLYTREHFQNLRDRLGTAGIVCQWLPLYQLDRDTLRLIVRTFLAVFPETRAWLLRPNLDTPVVGLIGYRMAWRYSPSLVEDQVISARLRVALQPLALNDTIQLLGGFLAGPRALRDFAGQGPLNTDDRPLVTFWAPRGQAGPRAPGPANLFELLSVAARESEELVADAPDAAEFRARLRNFIAARNDYLRGLAEEDRGQPAAAREFFLASARRSADFTTGYARALTHAMQLAATDPAAARSLLEQLAAARPEQPVARRLLEELERPSRQP